MGAVAHPGWRGNSFASHAPYAIRSDLSGESACPAVSDLCVPWGLRFWNVHNVVHVSEGQTKTRQEAIPICTVCASEREPHVVDLVDGSYFSKEDAVVLLRYLTNTPYTTRDTGPTHAWCESTAQSGLSGSMQRRMHRGSNNGSNRPVRRESTLQPTMGQAEIYL